MQHFFIIEILNYTYEMAIEDLNFLTWIFGSEAGTENRCEAIFALRRVTK